jgi:hypothetical protein
MKTVEIMCHSPALADSITLRHCSDDTGSVLALFKGAHLLVMLDPYPWRDDLAHPGKIESLALRYCAIAKPEMIGAARYVGSRFESTSERSEQP